MVSPSRFTLRAALGAAPPETTNLHPEKDEPKTRKLEGFAGVYSFQCIASKEGDSTACPRCSVRTPIDYILCKRFRAFWGKRCILVQVQGY